MDFHILEGPYECTEEPDKRLLSLGFKPPFKDWMKVIENGTKEDGTPSPIATADEAIDLIAKTIREEGPFDGVLGFS